KRNTAGSAAAPAARCKFAAGLIFLREAPEKKGDRARAEGLSFPSRENARRRKGRGGKRARGKRSLPPKRAAKTRAPRLNRSYNASRANTPELRRPLPDKHQPGNDHQGANSNVFDHLVGVP